MALKPDKTLCYKIDLILKEVDGYIETGRLDAIKVADLLHQVRENGQTMENAIKLRKQVMEMVTGLEDEYQAKKFNRETPTPGGINKIANVEVELPERPDIEILVKEHGKVLYHNLHAVAGIFSIVEKIIDVDEYGSFEGITQKFDFGHPLARWFAMDQFAIYFEGARVEVMEALKYFLNPRVLADKGLRKLVIKAIQLNKKTLS